jgi:hypothetical protein
MASYPDLDTACGSEPRVVLLLPSARPFSSKSSPLRCAGTLIRQLNRLSNHQGLCMRHVAAAQRLILARIDVADRKACCVFDYEMAAFNVDRDPLLLSHHAVRYDPR